jgi:hypothetical protein
VPGYTRLKSVHGIRGRTWKVSREWMRDMPAGEDEPFEHDVDGGHFGVIGILSILALLVIALALWFFPLDVIWPPWLWIPVLVVIGFFAVRWVLRRPWKIMAATRGHYGEDDSGQQLGPETWVGTVRGVTKSKEEIRLISQAIRKQDSPDYIGGVLKKLD